MSYRAGVWGAWNPAVVCDGVNCENQVTFAIDVASKPLCLVRGTPPAKGWDTNVLNGQRVDHCPECLAPATPSPRSPRTGGGE